MSAQLQEVAPGLLALSGHLDAANGSALRQAARRAVAASQAAHLVLDCSAVEHSSSVGLSLLLCLQRDAKACGKTLTIRALPAKMRQIAEVCELLELLPLAE
ncbi:STAS domain-containing protein [Pseudomonas sp. NW5]|uniref:STAS domain-containing protein n=1 Tax=Pseudomonas sp. NW5 TaxID=2934934 RepID=UPI002020787F|nr:STAS domain-containing protein [Pseudomonas sp. NW5]MCL7461487.1 STAS domain-containing protein [Pseudomonas sp. NW5]